MVCLSICNHLPSSAPTTKSPPPLLPYSVFFSLFFLHLLRVLSRTIHSSSFFLIYFSDTLLSFNNGHICCSRQTLPFLVYLSWHSLLLVALCRVCHGIFVFLYFFLFFRVFFWWGEEVRGVVFYDWFYILDAFVVFNIVIFFRSFQFIWQDWQDHLSFYSIIFSLGRW